MSSKEPKQLASASTSEYEVQVDMVRELTIKLSSANEKVEILKQENEALKVLDGAIIQDQDGNVIEWEMVEGIINIEMPEFKAIEGALLTNDTRTEMLMAMIPQVRVDYARSDAQRAIKAVDDIMEVWKIK
jgi:hypothetical protein